MDEPTLAEDFAAKPPPRSEVAATGNCAGDDVGSGRAAVEETATPVEPWSTCGGEFAAAAAGSVVVPAGWGEGAEDGGMAIVVADAVSLGRMGGACVAAGVAGGTGPGRCAGGGGARVSDAEMVVASAVSGAAPSWRGDPGPGCGRPVSAAAARTVVIRSPGTGLAEGATAARRPGGTLTTVDAAADASGEVGEAAGDEIAIVTRPTVGGEGVELPAADEPAEVAAWRGVFGRPVGDVAAFGAEAKPVAAAVRPGAGDDAGASSVGGELETTRSEKGIEEGRGPRDGEPASALVERGDAGGCGVFATTILPSNTEGVGSEAGAVATSETELAVEGGGGALSICSATELELAGNGAEAEGDGSAPSAGSTWLNAAASK